MSIAAYVLSCPERQAVLANSLASLRASDWGEEPVIIENRDTDPDRRMRIQNGARAALEQALSSGADFVLYLEDDVMFNRYLRHNLTRWAPLASARAEAPFFATLFRPPEVPASGTQAIANAADLPARCSYGNQALVLSRATVRYQLDHWSEESLEADHNLARLAGRLGPLWVHSPSLVQHLGGKSTWGGAFLQTADFAPLWKAGEDEAYDGPLTSAGVPGALRSCIERLPPCPSDLADTGIVIAAGGLHYLVNAWVCVHMLRRHGCALPIDVWYLGPEEMPPVFSRLLAAQGVECIDAHRRLAELPVRQLRGWALKPYALLASRFRHVLLLDADNVPARDPSFLFETPEYGRSGAIFWPDRSDRPGLPGAFLRANHPAWRLTGLEHRGDPSFESGQACVDKARCWRALRLALWMNEHADFWYQFVYGDKDTFHLAWRMLGAPWEMPARAPRILDDSVFEQVDFQGRTLFQHRHGDKWRLDGANRRIPGFLDETWCLEAIRTLREALFAELSIDGTHPRPRIAPGRWLWLRPGRPPTVLAFRDTGLVDAGDDKTARLWRTERGGVTVLADDLTISGRFRFVPSAEGWVSTGAETSWLVRLKARDALAAPAPAI